MLRWDGTGFFYHNQNSNFEFSFGHAITLKLEGFMSVKDENLVSSYYELIFESEIIAHFTKIILMVILKIKTNFEVIYIS